MIANLMLIKTHAKSSKLTSRQPLFTSMHLHKSIWGLTNKLRWGILAFSVVDV